MKKSYIILGIIGLVLIVAVITNPNQDRHKEVLKTKLNAYMHQSLNATQTESGDEWAQAGQALGLMMGGVMIENIIANMVSTDNYVLFSLTKINVDGKSKVVGIGAFGNVFLTSKLNDELNLGMSGKGE